MKKYQVTRKVLLVLWAVFMVVSPLLSAHQVSAAKVLTETVKSVSITSPDNREMDKSKLVFVQGATYTFAFGFDLKKYDNNLEDGDYFDFSVPAPLTVTAEEFDIVDAANVKVARARVTANGAKQGGSIRVTMSELEAYKRAKGVSSVTDVKGTFYLKVKFDDAHTDNKSVTFDGMSPAETLSYKVNARNTGGSLGLNGEVLFKGGGTIVAREWTSDKLGESGNVWHPWGLYMNRAQKEFDTLKVVDEVSLEGSPMQFIPESFKLYEVTFAEGSRSYRRGTQLPTDQYVTFSRNYTKFEIVIPNAGTRSFVLEYSTTGPNDGTDVANEATIYNNDEIQKPADNARTNKMLSTASSLLRQGGSIALDIKSRIYLIKVDENNFRTRLSGATFRITNNRGFDQTYTTNESGTLLSDQLTPGTYTVTEIAPPLGYGLSEPASFTVNVTAKGVSKTITNKPIETTTFTTTKKWVGGPTNKPAVVLELLRNGVPYNGAPYTGIPETQTIPEGPGVDTGVTWQHLPARDEHGVAYTYSVREQAVANYTTSYNADTTEITNTYVSPKTSYTATKVWSGGPAAKPNITLTLLRDGIAYPDAGEKTLVYPTVTATWDNLDETDANGRPYVYSVSEAPVANYEASYHADRNELRNTYVSPKTSYTAHKVWSGGPATKPTITLALLRDGVAYPDAGEKTLVYPTVTATWEDLDETDANGRPYVYSVEEVTDLADYEKQIVDNTVTNIFKVGVTSFTATKVWVNGPADKPTVTFVLQQNGVDYTSSDATKTLTNGTTSVTWDNLPARTNDGVPYTYSVREEPVAHYETSYNGNHSEVTNTYVSPKTSYTATKVWSGGPATKPDITLALLRDGVAYPDAGQKTLAYPTVTATWEDLDETDANGRPYVYSVEEVTDLADYEKRVAGNTVTNIFKVGVTSFTATKVWVNGPADKPTVTFVLQQNGVDYVAADATKTLANGVTSVTWDNLPARTNDGVPYTYSVREEPVAHYETSYNADRSEVINRYVSPKTDITATKQWVDGPAVKPAIELQLKRNGEAFGTPQTLSDGQTSFTWTGLDVTDAQGVAYRYTVDEVAVPANYRKTVSGLTVTNTYTPNQVSHTVNKVWIDGPTPRPTIHVQLTRNGEDLGAPVALTDGQTTHTWANLDETDRQGTPYVYAAKEVGTVANYVGRAETTGAQTTLTNTYVSDKTDITATKKWVGGPTTKPSVVFQLLRNGDVFREAVLEDGKTSVTWADVPVNDNSGVPFAYTVNEKPVANYTTTISGTEVTNTYVSPEITVTATKTWVGGPADRPTVQLQLFQNGAAYQAPVTLENGSTSYSWTVPATDQQGVAYTYTVDEVAVPEFYEKEVIGLSVVNTYRSPVTDVTGTVEWPGVSGTKPTIRLQLKANGQNVGEPITITDGVSSYTWTNVPKNDESGNPIVYTIAELDLPEGFSKETDGLVVTNRIKKVETQAIVQDAQQHTQDAHTVRITGQNGNLPNTGSDHNTELFVVAVGLIVAAMSLLYRRLAQR